MNPLTEIDLRDEIGEITSTVDFIDKIAGPRPPFPLNSRAWQTLQRSAAASAA